MLAGKILSAPRAHRRRLVALAGAPASGKSTLADSLAVALTHAGCLTQVIPMDGFHLDNRILSQRGILDRKGAPESFDTAGLVQLCKRLGDEDEVVFPVFDRSRDIAIAGAGLVTAQSDTIIVEGNYLLFDTAVWRPLVQYWDVAIRLDVSRIELRQRLIRRWLDHGQTMPEAVARAEGNDLQNADTIERYRLDVPGQIVLRNSQGKED
ncbi:MAG: nucleoside/nucleotide kinase family protein [Rhodobacteraceae bacterium]|nr:MAG: nucleoside/nucleotide kinase family protein [Paracoccaceae bacterium]